MTLLSSLAPIADDELVMLLKSLSGDAGPMAGPSALRGR
ncbi:hypothetical protein SUS17_2761 [Sphingomonas sp. S17]|nr:hypothetical protein SUS17_2761 [Sphingomonas sp. S17]